MDNTLVIIVLVIAILAIAALPRLWRGKQQDKTDFVPDSPGAASSVQTQRSPKLATAAEIDAHPFSHWLCDQACVQTGVDLRRDPLALTRLAEAGAKARKEIDSAGETEISLPYIAADARGPKHFMLKVTREQVAALPQQMI